MPFIEVEGKKIDLEEEGFLVNFEDWNEKVACALAEREGVSKTCPLTEEKMEILRFIRKYYKITDAFPVPSAICRNVHQPSQCVTEKFLEPIKVWKIAGLPKLSREMVEILTQEACG